MNLSPLRSQHQRSNLSNNKFQYFFFLTLLSHKIFFSLYLALYSMILNRITLQVGRSVTSSSQRLENHDSLSLSPSQILNRSMWELHFSTSYLHKFTDPKDISSFDLELRQVVYKRISQIFFFFFNFNQPNMFLILKIQEIVFSFYSQKQIFENKRQKLLPNIALEYILQLFFFP